MNLVSKIKTIATNLKMLPAYLRWLSAKIVLRRPPLLDLDTGAHLGEWVSFSEYWSFQNVMPEVERLCVRRCLAANSDGKAIAFDIGANVGAFTCLMGSFGHTVHAFEPIPETFCRLKNNVKSNGLLGRANLNCIAVGKEQGLVTFQTEEFGAATNRMIAPGGGEINSATSTQVVAVTSLDDYCRSQNIGRIDFVKLDVEGMEPYVLQGAKTLLRERRIAAILIEICPVNLREVGLSPADLWREFEVARYLPYALKQDGSPGACLSLAHLEAMSLDNVILLPEA
jgi:FkbM family methyltransferase